MFHDDAWTDLIASTSILTTKGLAQQHRKIETARLRSGASKCYAQTFDRWFGRSAPLSLWLAREQQSKRIERFGAINFTHSLDSMVVLEKRGSSPLHLV